LGIAISAAQQIDQSFVGKLMKWNLRCVGYHSILQAAVFDNKFVANLDQAGGRYSRVQIFSKLST
jgi:hypothetical protein